MAIIGMDGIAQQKAGQPLYLFGTTEVLLLINGVEYIAVGVNKSAPYGTSDFEASFPDLSTQGSTAAFSGAKQIGINAAGLIAVTATDVQDAIQQLDSAIGAGAVYAVPSLTFGESNAAGATLNAVPVDSTIALFDNSLPAPVAVGAGSKGLSGKASRHDHEHPFSLDPSDGGNFKSGAMAIGNGSTSVSVVFTTPFSTSIIAVTGSLENNTDPMPQDYVIRIGAKTVNGFTAYFSATDSANYILNYIATGT